LADWKLDAALISSGGASGTSVSSGGTGAADVGILLAEDPTTVTLLGTSVEDGLGVSEIGTSVLSVEGSGMLEGSGVVGDVVVASVVGAGDPG
jgi:hypothetical protein